MSPLRSRLPIAGRFTALRTVAAPETVAPRSEREATGVEARAPRRSGLAAVPLPAA